MGGHFYATSTLRDTCYGLYHDFINGRVSTNTQHVEPTFRVLMHMMAFYERDLTGAEGGMDIDFGESS